MSQGCFYIWPANANGDLVGEPISEQPPDINNAESVDIYFGVTSDGTVPMPKDQMDLQQSIGKMLRSIQVLFHCNDQSATSKQKDQFRAYYVRLFRVAQAGLQGATAAPDLATTELTTLTAQLIDDEAGRVKNRHLEALGRSAAFISTPFLLGFLLLRIQDWTDPFLKRLDISPYALSNFMLLWVGCFLGVWLSYGVRTTTFTLTDLTVTDSDRLQPEIRLIFAGSLTMLIGIALYIPLIEFKIGTFVGGQIARDPMLMFLVGCFCGISELVLPSTVAKRASDFMAGMK